MDVKCREEVREEVLEIKSEVCSVNFGLSVC